MARHAMERGAAALPARRTPPPPTHPPPTPPHPIRRAGLPKLSASEVEEGESEHLVGGRSRSVSPVPEDADASRPLAGGAGPRGGFKMYDASRSWREWAEQVRGGIKGEPKR